MLSWAGWDIFDLLKKNDIFDNIVPNQESKRMYQNNKYENHKIKSIKSITVKKILMRHHLDYLGLIKDSRLTNAVRKTYTFSQPVSIMISNMFQSRFTFAFRT